MFTYIATNNQYYMKKLLLLNLLFISSSYFSQTTIDKTIVSGGITRSYKLYIPAMYNGSTSVALVLNLHGLGSNSVQQMFYGDFRSIADTANFIIVHPQGTTSATLGSTYWNAYFGWVSSIIYPPWRNDHFRNSYNRKHTKFQKINKRENFHLNINFLHFFDLSKTQSSAQFSVYCSWWFRTQRPEYNGQ